MPSENRQALIRNLPGLLFAAFLLRYVILVVTHDPTGGSPDPLIKESTVAFLVSAVEFGLFLYPGTSYSRGRAALYGFLVLLCAILFVNVEGWKYPFG